MATVEQRGSSWRVSWRLGGRRDGARQSATFTTPDGVSPATTHKVALTAKQLAESRGHRITRDEVYAALLPTGRDVPTGMPTLADWVQQWVDDRRDGGDETDEVQADTLDGYLQILRLRVLPWLGQLYLSEIDEDTVRDWVKALRATRVRKTKANPKGKSISAQSVRRAHGVLHQVLGAAVPRWMPRNPAARPTGSRKNRVGLPKVVPFEGMFLTPAEVDLIHFHCSPAIRDLWFVLVRTGLRLGEALVLRVQDVTLDGGNPVIRVRRALKKGQKIGLPKSAKSRRDVTISAEVAKVLTARCEDRKPGDLLFPAPGRAGKVRQGAGDPWRENNLRRRHWLPALAAAQRCAEHPPPEPPKPRSGPRRKLRDDEVSTCTCPGRLKRSPRLHDARHTHVSLLVAEGWMPIRVQRRVGHASYQTTMNIYGHLWEGGDGEHLEQMERRLAMLDDEQS